MKKLQGDKLIHTFLSLSKWSILVFSFLAWYPHQFMTNWWYLVLPNDFTAYVFMMMYFLLLSLLMIPLNMIFDSRIEDYNDIKKYGLSKKEFLILTSVGHILGFFAWKVLWPGGLGL